MQSTMLIVAVVGAPAALASDITWSSLGVSPGQDVTIAADQSVIFDVADATVGELVVMGQLTFGDDQDKTLTAQRIMVTGDGALIRAGTPSDPFTHDLTITLTETIGDPSTQPMMGYRVLGTRDGASLQLHGASAAKTTWTQITADVAPGDTTLTTAVAAGWKAGDEIVLAPSGEDPRHAERLTVTSVSADGLTITFEPPLAHTHLGRVFTYAGKDIDMRAEVALLSRNITIQDPPDDADPKLGFHGMFMPTSGPINLSGVELQGGGQIARQGRYPIHWHRDPSLDVQFGSRGYQIEAPSRQGDWIRSCSIHTSGQRGIVVHGVNDIEVAENVVFDVWDHAYVFSEDGIEKGNTFTNNLSMLVKRKDSDEFAFPRDDHTESDQAEHRPAGFWGRNPFNPMVGNHAAGSLEGSGFHIDSRVMSYDMKRLIQREHATTETFVFEDNLAHSNYREGVAGGGIPTYGPKTRGHGLMVGDYNASFEGIFEGFRTYRNSVLGVWIEDERHTLLDAVLTDSSGGFIAFRSNIEDVVFNQRSDNTLGREPQNLGNRKHPAGGLHLQSTGYGNHANLTNVTFMNVSPGAVHMWKDPLGSSYETTLEGITLINTPAVFHSSDPDLVDGAYIDVDGSLVDMGPDSLIGGDNLLPRGGVYVPDLDVVVLPGGANACTPADIVAPFGVLDGGDIDAFVGAFTAGDTIADLAPPFDTIDLSDIDAFIAAFVAGCP
ncbi:MAG: G8 domain-containing protein [Planctomycetota bacterium]